MSEHKDYITLGQLIDAGAIKITLGFPCGNHNCEGEGVPHIRPFNIQPNGKISLEQIKSIPFNLASEKPTLRQDDIVFNNTNTKELVGKCAIWEGNQEFVFSNHMTRIRLHDKKIVNEYLNFAILHHWFTGKSEMLARSHVAQASIIGERFREILLPWRNTAEQALIANLLTCTHRAMTIQENQIKNTLELKNTIMLELFTKGLRNEGQKDTELGFVPKSWNILPIKDLGQIITGTTPPTQQRENYANGQIPFISPGDMEHGSKIEKTGKHITQAGLAASRPLPRFTTCFVCIGSTIGKVGITTHTVTATNQQINAIVPSEKYSPLYLFYLLTWWSNYIRSQASPSPVPILSKGAFEAINIYTTFDPVEQLKIVQILEAIDKKIDLHKKKQIILEDLFKTLLHKLMTGEARVSELDLSTLKKSVDIVGAFA